MCVWASGQMMGCGKSRHSPQTSETDVTVASGGRSNKKKGSGQGAKKAGLERKRSQEKKDGTGKFSPFKKSSSDRSNRSRLDRNDDIGGSTQSPKVKVSSSSTGSGQSSGSGSGEKSNNGAVNAGKTFTLEVPSEISNSKLEAPSRTTTKDFKTLTASKTVHVTNSQIEFFKMLDEKIEQGGDDLTSADTSEVSSIDDSFRH